MFAGPATNAPRTIQPIAYSLYQLSYPSNEVTIILKPAVQHYSDILS